MTSSNSVLLSVVLAVLCVLLVCPVSMAQSPQQCNLLLGSANLTQFPDTVELGSDGLIYAFGYFYPPLLSIYLNYEFSFTVPDQSGLHDT